METRRQASQWIIAMLVEDACDVSVDVLRTDLSRHLPNAPLFFPAETSRGTLAWDHALATYVFVGVGAETPVQRLTRSRYIAGLVQRPDRQDYERLNPAQMREVRRIARPRLLRCGTSVRILSGECKGLLGKVAKISRPDNRVAVRIRLHSKSLIVTVSLQEVERA